MSFGIRAQFFYCRSSPSSSSTGATLVYCQTTRNVCQFHRTCILSISALVTNLDPSRFLLDVAIVSCLLFCVVEAPTVMRLRESHTPDLFFYCSSSLKPMTWGHCRVFYFTRMRHPPSRTWQNHTHHICSYAVVFRTWYVCTIFPSLLVVAVETLGVCPGAHTLKTRPSVF